jgi:hypothetical protein
VATTALCRQSANVAHQAYQHDDNNKGVTKIVQTYSESSHLLSERDIHIMVAIDAGTHGSWQGSDSSYNPCPEAR